MNNSNINDELKTYYPQLSLVELIIEVNKIYHAFEAHKYDERHPELFSQLPKIWHTMTVYAASRNAAKKLRVLDFGCGTGFEADQILNNIPTSHIELLVCYDPSPAMIERCRAKIASRFPAAIFVTHLDQIPTEQRYNLLATNSLLHHLPEPRQTIADIEPLLSEDAIWLNGHEPSSRYYKNAACIQVYEQYRRERNWMRFTTPQGYVRYISQWIGFSKDPASRTAYESYKRGLFLRKPPPKIIGLLVDFHVAHSVQEANSGRGFDFTIMQRDFAPIWRLDWVKTYSFMGPFYEGRLSLRWRHAAEELSLKYFQDGANFSAIWSRS